jgi:hypothetical protein
MTVPETDRGIRRHHVQIAFSFYIPEPYAFAFGQHYWQRMVIVRTVLVFQVNHAFHGSLLASRFEPFADAKTSY